MSHLFVVILQFIKEKDKKKKLLNMMNKIQLKSILILKQFAKK